MNGAFSGDNHMSCMLKVIDPEQERRINAFSGPLDLVLSSAWDYDKWLTWCFSFGFLLVTALLLLNMLIAV